uniref:Ornithine decarboxylase n=1 Tax=Heligmosomoides polygyrus TaxID=6339 RepID=A0A183FIC7_HELPZ
LYIPPVSETGEGFVLVIIMPIQKAWFERYGARAIIIDDTFNLTTYCLSLATVVVVDERDKGLPAAYLLSNRFVLYYLEYAETICYNMFFQND